MVTALQYSSKMILNIEYSFQWNVRNYLKLYFWVAEQSVHLTKDHDVSGLNPGQVQIMTVWGLVAYTLSVSPLHYLDMTEVILKET